jgi:pyridoxamine 5'-phosphate oxidase
MIKFTNLSSDEPYLKFNQKYIEAFNANQKNIEAICISSYSQRSKEVNSRFVNLKFVDNKDFLFFSNYESPKSQEFRDHKQISALIFWNSINTQIRLKAVIKKTSKIFNNNYFLNRSEEKNALAISSNQSKIIDSFDAVQEKFKKSLKNEDLKECPKYWGGYSFKPYEIEFWEGNEFRLNKRNLYTKDNTSWNHFILEP